MSAFDFQNNFLLRKEDSGKTVAEAMCLHLQELNPRAQVRPVSSLNDTTCSAVVLCNPTLQQLRSVSCSPAFAVFTNGMSSLFIDLSRSK